MKKKIIASFFVVAALMLVVSQISFAQDMEGRLGLGARVSYVNYSGDDYTVYGFKVDVEPDESAMYGVNLTYFVHRYLSLELSVDYVEADVDLEVLGVSVNIGELEQIPILLSLRTHLSTNPKVSPYLTIGIGYYLNDFNLSGLVTSVTPPGAELDPDDSVGFHAGGGIEYFFNEHFAFNFDLKYLWNKTDVKDKAPGYTTVEYSVDLNSFIAGIGFKYYF